MSGVRDGRSQVSLIAGRRFNLGSTREALKYKNTVPQKTSYRDTELQIQVLTSNISREERKPGWKKKGEEAGEGGWKGWPCRRLLPPTDTQAFPLKLLWFQHNSTRQFHIYWQVLPESIVCISALTFSKCAGTCLFQMFRIVKSHKEGNRYNYFFVSASTIEWLQTKPFSESSIFREG